MISTVRLARKKNREMSSMTTRQRARESSIQLTSVENARRLEDEAMFQRQTYLRKLLHSSGFIAPHGSRIERLLFNIQESAGAELAASELAWFLSNLGKILRRACWQATYFIAKINKYSLKNFNN